MADLNDDLRKLQASLIKTQQKLAAALDEPPDDVAAMEAIMREIQEVGHRIVLVGQLLFARQSQALAAKVADVEKATKKTNAAIRDMESIKDFLDALNDLLTLVDDAIQIAKALMV
jgi:hypothetical protein